MAHVEKQIEVEVPVRTAYNQWTQFEEFPEFMEGIQEVRQLDETRLHWTASIAGRQKEWDARITEQVPDERVAWVSESGARNDGIVEFQPVGPDRTLVSVRMDFEPEGLVENVGSALGMAGGRIEGDLGRFKEFIESRGVESGAWRGQVQDGDARPAGSASMTGSESYGSTGSSGTSMGSGDESGTTGESMTGGGASAGYEGESTTPSQDHGAVSRERMRENESLGQDSGSYGGSEQGESVGSGSAAGQFGASPTPGGADVSGAGETGASYATREYGETGGREGAAGNEETTLADPLGEQTTIGGSDERDLPRGSTAGPGIWPSTGERDLQEEGDSRVDERGREQRD